MVEGHVMADDTFAAFEDLQDRQGILPLKIRFLGQRRCGHPMDLRSLSMHWIARFVLGVEDRDEGRFRFHNRYLNAFCNFVPSRMRGLGVDGITGSSLLLPSLSMELSAASFMRLQQDSLGLGGLPTTGG